MKITGCAVLEHTNAHVMTPMLVMALKYYADAVTLMGMLAYQVLETTYATYYLNCVLLRCWSLLPKNSRDLNWSARIYAEFY